MIQYFANISLQNSKWFYKGETSLFIEGGVSKVDQNPKNASLAPNLKNPILVKERRTCGH